MSTPQDLPDHPQTPELNPKYVKSHRARLVRLLSEMQESLRVVAPDESDKKFPDHARVDRIVAIFNEVIGRVIVLGPEFHIRSVSDEEKGDLLMKIWMIASGQK